MKDKTFLLICTVRYALSRRSYAVDWICNLLKKHWNNIPMNDRKIILEDIKKYKNKKYFSTLDQIVWQEILDLGIKDGLILRRDNMANEFDKIGFELDGKQFLITCPPPNFQKEVVDVCMVEINSGNIVAEVEIPLKELLASNPSVIVKYKQELIDKYKKK